MSSRSIFVAIVFVLTILGFPLLSAGSASAISLSAATTPNITVTAGQAVTIGAPASTIELWLAGTTSTLTINSITITGPGTSPNGSAPVLTSTGAACSTPSGWITGGTSFVFYKAETVTLIITVTGLNATTFGFSTSVSVTCTVLPAAAASFTITDPTSAATVQAGTTYTVSGIAIDTYGNPRSGDSIAWSVTGTGSVASPTTTNASGVATTTFTPGNTTGNSGTVTGTGATASTSNSITTIANSTLNNFNITTPGAQTAGGAFTITVVPRDAYNNPILSSTFAVSVTGAATSAGGFAPILPTLLNSNGAGTATPSFTLYNAASTTITFTSGAVTGSTGAFAVGVATANLVVITDPTTAEDILPTGTRVISALVTDTYGNPKNLVSVAWAVTGTGSVPTPTNTIPTGIATTTFTPGTVAGNYGTVTATAGGISDTSGTITTVHGPVASV
ncbi:MAG: hypothetical protein WC712_12340, partial [Candidatus Brocadiia bacterium]